MLNWANRFNIFCLLDNNFYSHQNSEFEFCVAAGSTNSQTLEPGKAFEQLTELYNERKSWLFGHLGYGLKNEIERLPNNHPAEIDFGLGFFFEPQYVAFIRKEELHIVTAENNHAEIFQQIIETEPAIPYPEKLSANIYPEISKADYLEKLHQIKKHIARGDCYELNFCQPFFADHVSPDPINLFLKLNTLSPNPFAALYKWGEKYCICASPERFLQKKGETLISQPIKGTAARNLEDATEDARLAEGLLKSEKERSENVMVVDLVRNDLSKVAQKGTVQVKELFGLYAFPQVHQMISTIEAKLDPKVHPVEAIRACFPMGSMTGAPKKRVMELIDETESSARGLYSGAIGYFSPEGDFDFNVVIRSLFLDRKKKKLSFWAGGGITANSNPEAEYEESILKAKAIVAVLNAEMQN